MLRPVPAPTSVPMPKRTPAATWRAIGKIPEGRKALVDGLGLEVAVRDHEAAGDPQSGCLGGSEERVLGGREMGAEDERALVVPLPAGSRANRSALRVAYATSAVRASSGSVRW